MPLPLTQPTITPEAQQYLEAAKQALEGKDLANVLHDLPVQLVLGEKFANDFEMNRTALSQLLLYTRDFICNWE